MRHSSFALVLALLSALNLQPSTVHAQTVLLAEDFEGAFPGTAWTVGDNNSEGTPAYWDDVPADFGGEGAHGNWKGYCAGTGFAGDAATPTYQNHMTAYMSRPVNLAGSAAATLIFWYKIPSIESCCDAAKVYLTSIDPMLLWSSTNPVPGWTEATIDLTPHVGNTVTLRFEFTSDHSVTHEGWYLDDIVVIGFPVPANDVCDNAITLADGVPYLMNTIAAQSNDGSPTCQGNFGKGVWFHYTPPASGPVEVSTCGSGFDTVLQVYSGFCNPEFRPPVACTDDDGPLCAGRQASVQFNATAGTTYRILAGGYGAASGTLAIVARWRDTIPPIITCPNHLTVPCPSSVPPRPATLSQFLEQGGHASDNRDTNLAYHASDTVTEPGTILRTHTVTDGATNAASCVQQITVQDTTPPTITCVAPKTVECGAAWAFDNPGATDNCGGVSVAVISTVTNAACGNTFTATRTWRASDTNGNTAICSQTVTVQDTTPPNLTCAGPRTVPYGTAWNFDTPTTADVCSSTNVTLQIVSTVTNGSPPCAFTATRTWRATDPCGNVAACSQTVTVVDQSPPTIVCPGHVALVTDPGSCSKSNVTFLVTATDNCANVNVTCDPPSGSDFPKGVTTVRCVATDLAGNTNACNFTVTVRDTEAPRIVCPNDLRIETCDNGTPVTLGVGAVDNCDAAPAVTCVPPSGSFFPMGATPVLCTTADSSGNSNQCSFSVIVGPKLLPPFGLSSGTEGSEPDVAFDPLRRRWLVVWREGSATFPNAGEILGRLVDEAGTPAAAPVSVSGGLVNWAGAPRVAFDPVGGEFLAVWASGGDPMESAAPTRVRARRISAAGALLGSGALAVSEPDGQGEANPDVAAGRVRPDGVSPWQPYWLVVWEDTRTANRRLRVHAVFPDPAAAPSQLRLSSFPLVLDDQVLLPNHQSLRPRLADDAMVEESIWPVGFAQSIHQVVFEIQEGSGANLLSDIYGARLTHLSVHGVAHLTCTSSSSQNESEPRIVWNGTTGRSLLVFRRLGEVDGQLLAPLGSAPWFDPIAGEFRIDYGDGLALAPLVSDGSFVGVKHVAAGNEGMHVAGHHVFSLFGVTLDTDQPAVALNQESGSAFLMAYRSGGYSQNRAILGRLFCGLFPPTNHPPLAHAGPDLQVFAGTPFALDGAGSSDPDGDLLVYRWTQISGKAATFLNSSNLVSPLLEAPVLDPGAPATNLAFRLDVDDLRSVALFPTNDTVTVRVIRGSDGHPPVADAGTNRTVNEDVDVPLDGSASSDPDGEPIAFAWKFDGYLPATNLPPPTFMPSPANSSPSFHTPRFSRPGGLDMVFRLRVSSASGGFGDDTVTLHVNDSVNEDPVALAGADRTEDEHLQFALNGTGSWDPNGDSLRYQWQVLSTPNVWGGASEEFKLYNANTAYPTVDLSVFDDRDVELQLTVSDGRGGQHQDRVTVHVQALPMQVASVTPMNGSPGTAVTIAGFELASVSSVSFHGSGGSIRPVSDWMLEVTVPNGPRVRPGSGAFLSDYHAGLFDVWEHPNVTTGPLVVSDPQTAWTAPQPFQIAHVELRNILLTQGLKHNKLVRGKDSLLQVQVRTREASGSNALASTARCLVFTNSNLTPPAALDLVATNPPRHVVPRSVVPTEMNQSFNFFLDGQHLTAPKLSFSIAVTHHGVETLYLESLFPTDEFGETVSPRILVVPIVPIQNGQVAPTFNATRFWANYATAQDTFRRIYPVGGVEFIVHPSYFSLPSMMDDDGLIELESFGLTGNFISDMLPGVVQLHGILEDWNDGHPNQRAMFVVGAIDSDVHDPFTTTGFGVPPRDMMARMVKYSLTEDLPVIGPILEALNEILSKILCFFCLFLCDCPDPIEEAIKAFFGLLDAFGATIEGDTCFVALRDGAATTLAHELGHNLGFVDPYAFNSDPDNLSHSKFDEGIDHDTRQPPPVPVAGLRFIDAGYAWPPVYNVQPPGAMLFEAEPKSLMSYVDGKTKDNTFHEPSDYEHLRSRFLKPAGVSAALRNEAGPAADAAPVSNLLYRRLPVGSAFDGSNGSGLKSRDTADWKAALPGGVSEPKLKLLGWLNLTNGQATVAQSKLLSPRARPSLAESNSALGLVFLDAGSAVLREVFVPFSFFFHTSPTEPIRELPVLFALFETIQPMPERTDRVELRWRGAVAWSRRVSPHPPVVQILAPAAGAHLPAQAAFTVRWTATDADGDALTHDVSYSPDGGATFIPLTTMIATNEFLWLTHVAPESTQGFLKVEASDGFNVGSALAGPFTVDPKPPLVSITSPASGARLAQSAGVALAGTAYDFGRGVMTNAAAYQWASSRDGWLGQGRRLAARGLSLGAHDLILTVTSALFTATSSVPVLIVADTDGDGIPDEVEAATPGLNPNDPADLFTDEDGDGLARAAELLRFGTDPNHPDSDGDGVSDGAEVTQGFAGNTADMDADGVPDGQDNCPFLFNPGQEDRDQDRTGDACQDLLGDLIITSVRCVGEDDLRVAFRVLPDTLAYKYVLEAAPSVSGPWQWVNEAELRRAQPPAAFEFAIAHPHLEPYCFFRVRKL